MILKRDGEWERPRLVLDLSEKASSFSPWTMMLPVEFL